MSHVLLVNPRKRGAKKRAAKRKMPAGLAAYHAKKRRAKKSTAKRAAPIFSNPSPARSKRRKSGASIFSAMKKRRKNPAMRLPSLGGIKAQAITAATGAAGAIVVDTAFSKLPLPAMLKTGVGRHASKAALAVALGIVGKKVLPKHAAAASLGALTVVLYGAGRDLLTRAGMGGQLGEYLGEYLAGDELAGDDLGEYLAGDLDGIDGDMDALGYYNAALPLDGLEPSRAFNTANV